MVTGCPRPGGDRPTAGPR